MAVIVTCLNEDTNVQCSKKFPLAIIQHSTVKQKHGVTYSNKSLNKATKKPRKPGQKGKT